MFILALVSYSKIVIEWKYHVYPDNILKTVGILCDEGSHYLLSKDDLFLQLNHTTACLIGHSRHIILLFGFTVHALARIKSYRDTYGRHILMIRALTRHTCSLEKCSQNGPDV
jgi:hypothetical protein